MKILNANIITNGYVSFQKDILLEDGIIASIADSNSMIDYSESTFDVKNKWVAPGFIDLQIYGAGGALYQNTFDEESLNIITETLYRFGVTNFLASMTSTSIENYKKSVDCINRHIITNPNTVLGLNLEGPFINKKKGGFHDAYFIRNDVPEFFDILSELQNGVAIVTIAPEVLSTSYLNSIDTNKIFLSIGHSMASYEDASDFFNKGIKLSTHLFNGMTGVSGREPGIATAVLENDKVFSSIIADGFHIQGPIANLIYKLKGHELLFLISDGMPPLGSSVASFLYENTLIDYKDGCCLTTDGVLAGTAISIVDGLKNFIKWTGISLEVGIKLITEVPASVINKNDKLGSVQEGYIANLTIIDDELNVYATIVNGEIKWQKPF